MSTDGRSRISLKTKKFHPKWEGKILKPGGNGSQDQHLTRHKVLGLNKTTNQTSLVLHVGDHSYKIYLSYIYKIEYFINT